MISFNLRASIPHASEIRCFRSHPALLISNSNVSTRGRPSVFTFFVGLLSVILWKESWQGFIYLSAYIVHLSGKKINIKNKQVECLAALCRAYVEVLFGGSISFCFRVKGGGQLAELPGRAENLKNCSCCCHASVLLGGGSSAFGFYMFSLCTGISLYFLISWLFRMGSHWQHWKV